MSRTTKAAAIILATLVALALLSTHTFFFFRDNFSTHFAVKALSGEALRGGTLPLWNFAVGGGQPLAGNPNTLTFYPDTLLFVLLPPMVAFNLHFLLHLALAVVAMGLLLRALDVPRDVRWWIAAAYGGSGVVLTATAFYNLITATALIPLALLALLHLKKSQRWRDALLLGAVCGLMGLAGEPVMVLGTLLLLAALLPVPRTSARIASRLIAAVLTAVAVASPQLVAYSEIAGEVERSVQHYSAATVLAASLPWWRLPELVVGPIYGSLLDLTTSGYLSNAPRAQWPPLFISIAVGMPLLASFAVADSRIRPFRWLAGITLFIALGAYNPVMRSVVEQAEWLRVVRYPEKLMLHFNVCAFVMIALWITHLERARRRAAFIIGGGCMAVAVLFGVLLVRGAGAPVLMRTAVGLGLGLLMLLLVRRNGSPAQLGALTLFAAAVWNLPLIPLDARRPYEIDSGIPAGARIWRPASDSEIAADSAQERYRLKAAAADATFASARGVRYALDRSPEGMYSYLSRIVAERAEGASADLRHRYALMLGCDAIVSRGSEPGAALGVTRLDGVAAAQSPATLLQAGSIGEAVRMMESAEFDPLVSAVVPRGTTGGVAAQIRELGREQDVVRLAVRSRGPAVVMVNETWFRAWRVTVDGRDTRTFPANVDRLAFVVGAGEHIVEATFGRRRTLILLCTLLSATVLLTSLFLSGGRAWRLLRQPDTGTPLPPP